MTRIGRQIPHYAAVDISSIKAHFSDDRKYRYQLKMKYGGTLYDTVRSKHAAVVLKNPSAADSHAADSTIRKVETYIHHHLPDVSVLTILNLFALRATDTEDVNEEYEEHGPEAVIGPQNDAVIRRVLLEADYIIVAWGNRSRINQVLYEERVLQMEHLIKGLHTRLVYEVQGDQETSFPLHGMMWGYQHELVPARMMNESA